MKERMKAINDVESLFKNNGQRWAVIQYENGLYDIVPEISLPIENTTIIYQLKP